MTRLALAGKCGFFGSTSKRVGEACASPIRTDNAIPPSPAPTVSRKPRRLNMRRIDVYVRWLSVDIYELIGAQQHLAKIGVDAFRQLLSGKGGITGGLFLQKCRHPAHLVRARLPGKSQ